MTDDKLYMVINAEKEQVVREFLQLTGGEFVGPLSRLLEEWGAQTISPLPPSYLSSKERGSKPKILILMPIYQAGSWWHRTEQALLNLRPQPDLYIFAENNSTDNTLELLTKFKRPRESVSLTPYHNRGRASDFLDTSNFASR